MEEPQIEEGKAEAGRGARLTMGNEGEAIM